ncbi:hypothetical protein [Metalysinibacillus jejuensis]|uniref:hypothetical protein n=1 Tax=Metalysinibacillus jejuensis TaxID=914327 RepID=UPI00128FDCF4|nr:hypothetical protein [Metalysinibacillus jejuensis]
MKKKKASPSRLQLEHADVGIFVNGGDYGLQLDIIELTRQDLCYMRSIQPMITKNIEEVVVETPTAKAASPSPCDVRVGFLSDVPFAIHFCFEQSSR